MQTKHFTLTSFFVHSSQRKLMSVNGINITNTNFLLTATLVDSLSQGHVPKEDAGFDLLQMHKKSRDHVLITRSFY